jgi:acetylornithine/N-succinyldiaminopimelate aminotransferase
MTEPSPLFETYARADIAFDHGEGSWLVDTRGERYLDFGGGIAVSALGHAHPHLVETLREQAGKLWHTSNLYEVPEQRRLAQRLVEATFADKVFFTNSGAEALECAIKTSRRYHYAGGHPERFASSLSRVPFTAGPWRRSPPAVSPSTLRASDRRSRASIRFRSMIMEALKAAITDETAAILIEPVQGEGGIRPCPMSFCAICARFATRMTSC